MKPLKSEGNAPAPLSAEAELRKAFDDLKEAENRMNENSRGDALTEVSKCAERLIWVCAEKLPPLFAELEAERERANAAEKGMNALKELEHQRWAKVPDLFRQNAQIVSERFSNKLTAAEDLIEAQKTRIVELEAALELASRTPPPRKSPDLCKHFHIPQPTRHASRAA